MLDSIRWELLASTFYPEHGSREARLPECISARDCSDASVEYPLWLGEIINGLYPWISVA